jgi:hypothetical protein
MTRTSLSPSDVIKPDTPLQLGVVVRIAFSDSSMTVSGMRREGARGQLLIAEANPRA